jgi:hypothetical protein
VSNPFEIDGVNVNPIPLPAQGDNPADGTTAIVIGWGRLQVSLERKCLSQTQIGMLVRCLVARCKSVYEAMLVTWVVPLDGFVGITNVSEKHTAAMFSTVPPKRRYLPTSAHLATIQAINSYIFAAVGTSNLITLCFLVTTNHISTANGEKYLFY